MLNMTASTDAICETLMSLKHELNRTFQRRMVVLSGSEQWCFSTMESLARRISLTSGLFVSDQAPITGMAACPAIKLKHHLGQEYEHLVWDGFSSLNPDALGIASGLLKGGGFFFLLLPDFKELTKKGDPDYRRMCSDDTVFEQCHTFFLQRLITHLKTVPSVLIFDEQSLTRSGNDQFDAPNTTQPNLPTADQLQAMAAIRKVATGHRYRPLVLQADRGRGKSSVLGIAAAQLYIEQHHSIAITAPSKQTCEPAFRHYQQAIEAHFSCPEAKAAALSAFQFIPIDQLVEQSNFFHLLMIDEAAAISNHFLQTLLGQHPRIVFATTLHGYEGHGQGFAIRFKQILDTQAPQWKSVSLRTPIRWLEHDPLEAWFFRFLLLDTEPAKSQAISLPEIGPPAESKPEDKFQIFWLNQRTLAEQEPLFEAVFTLLVSAHYQTKPSDIRFILDHPHIHIAIATSESRSSVPAHSSLLGVLLILEEGGLPADLADAIIAGQRRPRGHLFPQALCVSTGDPAFLVQRSYRITRIAVHVDARQQGVGSALLEAAHKQAANNRIDSLSTSFGLQPELLAFWRRNQFAVVKLGLHADGASASQSIMLMRAISDSAHTLQARTRRSFSEHFLFNLNRLYQPLPATECLAILEAIAPMVDTLGIAVDGASHTSSSKENNLRAFAFGHRSFEEGNLELYRFALKQIAGKNWYKLDQTGQVLIVMKLLQAQDMRTCEKQLKLKGKKAIDLRLRAALQVLLGP